MKLTRIMNNINVSNAETAKRPGMLIISLLNQVIESYKPATHANLNISCPSHTIHMPSPSNPTWFDHPNPYSVTQVIPNNVQVLGPVQHFIACWSAIWVVVSPLPSPQDGGQSLVCSQRLLFQYIYSFPPCLEAISCIHNVRTFQCSMFVIYLCMSDFM